LRQPLAAAIADRLGGEDQVAPAVLAGAVAAAARVALERWVRPRESGFVVVSGERPLAGLLREALSVVAPALREAGQG